MSHHICLKTGRNNFVDISIYQWVLYANHYQPCTTHTADNKQLTHFLTNLSGKGVRHGKRRCDPTVSVDHVCWQSADDALDRLTNILCRCDDHGTGEEQHRGEHIVQSENRIVSPYWLIFKVNT